MRTPMIFCSRLSLVEALCNLNRINLLYEKVIGKGIISSFPPLLEYDKNVSAELFGRVRLVIRLIRGEMSNEGYCL